MSPFGSRPAGARRERLIASPRFRDGTFRNTAPVSLGLKPGTGLSTMGQFLLGGQRRTPPGPLPLVDPREQWARRVDTGLRATWLGHSTVLLELDGVRVLTDPVWSERASPTQLAGPKRFQPVPVPISALPPLDAVVISHDHYDHLDAFAVRELARTGVCFVTSLGVGAHLEAWGVPAERIVELDWWESFPLPRAEASITAAPAQHFSGRGVSDRNATLWSSMVVKTGHHAVFFSGDTGLTPEYQEIARRLGPFDLIMLEVGAFHPAWGDIHLGPDNALEAVRLLGGGALLPVHWGTFNLAIHAWDEPAEVLFEQGPRRGARVLMPRLGAAFEPAHELPLEPWWRELSREPAGERADARAEARAARPDEAPGQPLEVGEPVD